MSFPPFEVLELLFDNLDFGRSLLVLLGVCTKTTARNVVQQPPNGPCVVFGSVPRVRVTTAAENAATPVCDGVLADSVVVVVVEVRVVAAP